VLVAALAVVVVSVVAMAYLAHRQGLIVLPFLPAPVEVAGTEDVHTDEGPTSGITDHPADVALSDSTAVSVTADSIVVAVVDAPPAGEEDADLPSANPGTGPDLRPEDTDTPPSEIVVPAPERDLPPLPAGFYVHVSSFRELARADLFAADCAAGALPPRIRDVSIDGQLWYRVYVGPYGNQEAAQEAEASVKEHRLSTWTMIVRIR